MNSPIYITKIGIHFIGITNEGIHCQLNAHWRYLFWGANYGFKWKRWFMFWKQIWAGLLLEINWQYVFGDKE